MECFSLLKQPPRDVLLEFRKIHRKTPVPESPFLIKLQAVESDNFIKKETLVQVFSTEFCEIIRKRFLTEHFQQNTFATSAPIFVTFVSAIVDVLQELPYHLERLLDNNRLIRCLMDWEVFDRMYSEEFSIDLLHSWRQVVICLLNYFISSRLKI